MPHATLKLRPGVDTNETPVLNEAAISACNLIRFKPDTDQGFGLVEKLGGWAQFYTGKMQAPVRQLLAWEDLNSNQWVAAGLDVATSGPAAGQTGLLVMAAKLNANGLNYGSNLNFITPLFLSSDIAPNFSTVANSSTVTVVDTTSTNLLPGAVVYVANQIAVGGLVLFGMYQITNSLSATSYQFQAVTTLGAPALATTTVSNSGSVPSVTTVLNSSIASVNLTAHGLQAGSTFVFLVPITVGGVLFTGTYTVLSVTDANNFTIQATATATSGATASVNGGNARLVYNVAQALPTSNTGYGIGGYGMGGYGIGGSVSITPALPSAATDWSLDNWGEVLIACPSNCVVDGINMEGLYQWDPLSGASNAVLIPQGPSVNDGFFVAMPQRQLIAWGSTVTGVQDPLLVRWCDVSNFNNWYDTVSDQSGSYRIPKGSRIVGGIQGPQQGLLWTDLGIWSMQYTGPPYTYSFEEIGSGCGLISRKAGGAVNGVVYWMSQAQFFSMSGSGITPLSCPVWDIIFQNLDQANLRKIRFAANSLFNEISWFYPSKQGGGEVDSYVKYNFVLGAWDYGSLGRSAWINQSVVGPPLGADPNSLFVYQHEISPDADGQPMMSYATTGWFSLSDADVMTFIDEVWPDFKWGYFGGSQNATINLTFNIASYPNGPFTSQGPFQVTSLSQFFSPRIRGRLVQMTFGSSDTGSFWRLGGLRYRGAPDGRYG